MPTRKYRVKETIVTVTADERYHPACLASILDSRGGLERHIASEPFFKVTFEPCPCPPDAPEVVRRMVAAAALAGVGPMAAVAGTIAGLALEAMVEAGCTHGIVDNGGDIAIINSTPVTVGIYAGESPMKNLGLEIGPRRTILGICTSSATVGPSISLGNADAALVVSEDVALADAAATALGNRITGPEALPAAFEFLKAIPAVDGAIGIIGDRMAAWGRVPRIVRADVAAEKITRGD